MLIRLDSDPNMTEHDKGTTITKNEKGQNNKKKYERID